VIGREGRNIDAAQALDHVAGYSILNDTSMRDFQRRTKQFLAGKTFEHSTPVGPVMTTTDTLGDGSGLRVHTTVDGVTKQDSNTDELLFTVPELVADLSTIITLEPGDLIATGTPSGVGNARTPQEFLAPGSEVVMTIDGIGELRNRCEPG
ncbi:MAG: fumarylacetoacetate hydrolase family protein, partial [Acidimicrobiales bacterium]